MTRTRLGTLALALLVGTSLAPAPAAAFVVFDPSNYAENVLTAARSLEQINNQIRSLQNEAVMLQNMARNLQPLGSSPLGSMTATFQRVETLMQQAEGVTFQQQATEAAIQQQYSDSASRTTTADGALAAAGTRWTQATDAYRDTMRVQAQVVANTTADGGVLNQVMNSSQGAAGGLQAQQAGNQLLALCVKQQMQIQMLMAAQDRAQTLDQARRAQDEADARAVTAHFLGTGQAYTPSQP